jgi:hypothetical protein
VFQQNETATPVRHENPDEADEEDSTAAVRQALASRLGQRLEQSSVNLTDGQYEQAQAVLGDEYSELLGQYAEVSADSESGETVEDFQQAREQQQTLANDVSEYQRTYRDYRDAKSAGETQRARELARQLLTLQETIQQNSSDLNTTYSELQAGSGVDTTTEAQQIQSVSQNVTEIQEQVRDAEFTPTRLTARTTNRNGSFVEPIGIQGTLHTTNGTAVGAEQINITVDSQTYAVTTNESGSFTLLYRPVTQPLATDSVSVAYEPTVSSLYLGSNTTVNTSITEATVATLRVDTITTTAGFNDQLTVRGQVTANNTSVGGLPLSVQIGTRDVARVETGENGSFTVQGRLPADIAPGNRPIRITTTEDNQAVTARESRTIDIVRRTPTLTATTGPEGNETIIVSGQLTGPDGTPLSNEALSVRVQNETTVQIETGPDGTYEHTLAVETLPANASTVTVQYQSGTSNLAAVTATAALPAQYTPSQPGVLASLQQRPLLSLVGLGLIFSALGGSVYVYRRTTQSSTEKRDPPAEYPESQTATGYSESAPPTLASARSALERDEVNEVVISAYTAIRTEIANRYSISPQTTHWQFYNAAVDHDIPMAGEFETLTTQYEAAQYAPNPVTADAAHEMLTTAEDIQDTLDAGTSSTDSSTEQ